MASLAVRVAFLYDEGICFLFFAHVQPVALGTRSRRFGWVEKWVSAFRAEEVQFVVVALTEDRIVESDETWLDDRRLAMMAAVREFLPSQRAIPSFSDRWLTSW